LAVRSEELARKAAPFTRAAAVGVLLGFGTLIPLLPRVGIGKAAHVVKLSDVPQEHGVMSKKHKEYSFGRCFHRKEGVYSAEVS
jgi:hypothetical protein